MAVHDGEDRPHVPDSSPYWRIRRSLARVALLRSTYYLWRAIRDAMHDSSQAGRAELNQEFEFQEDPWDYKTSYQMSRIRSEVEMLNAVRGAEPFKRVLEVGCAEGLFTVALAPSCEHLLAVDISEVAIARARRTAQEFDWVDFALRDIRTDPVPETFDLIVVVHALEYVRNPLYIWRARTKLVNSLCSGGYLLLGTMKVADIYEDAWWGRYLLRSGKHINNFFAKHPELRVVRTAELHLGKDYQAFDMLLQKERES
jgi:2-polyprenyl-3-methyl-5-hydroxy-6-metoxy-1,4-benzoquinol methylase